MSRPRWPYRVFVATLTVMLAWNVVGWVRNQAGFKHEPRLEYGPKNIREVAWLNKNPSVAYTFAAYYLIAEHLAGATLIAERRDARNRFELERIARLRLELAHGPLALDAAAAAAVGGERVGFRMRLARNGEPHDAALLIEPGAHRYVLAHLSDGSLLILSEAGYLAAGGANLMPK